MDVETMRAQAVRSLGEGVELRLQLIDCCVDLLIQAAEAIYHCLKHGGKILLFGNGGSAADAQHIAAEFVGRFGRDRVPLSALAITTDTSALTAIGNDYSFDQVFDRQIRALARPGDVAVAISTSGRSPNIIAGVQAGHDMGLTVIGLTGGDGGKLAGLADIAIVVPSAGTPRIQECHITIGHILCEIVETMLFPELAMKNVPSQAANLQSPASNSKLMHWDILLALRRQWRAEGKTVVWTNGCFDLLHVGHVRSLEAARRLGQVLVVGVNSDPSVRQLKGDGRPIVPASQRAEVLTALKCVDYVVIFDEATPEAALSRLKPDVHCKGADYAPPHGKPIPEAGVVESYGGRIEFLPLFPSVSTSDLIQRICEQSDAGFGKER